MPGRVHPQLMYSCHTRSLSNILGNRAEWNSSLGNPFWQTRLAGEFMRYGIATRHFSHMATRCRGQLIVPPELF